jgi:hypothetical protein
MDLHHNRISENLLFGLLLATVAGSVTAPAAAGLHLVSGAGACFASAPVERHGPFRS